MWSIVITRSLSWIFARFCRENGEEEEWRNWFASGSRDIENFNDPRVRGENLGESFLCSRSIFVLINLCAIIVRFEEVPSDRFWGKEIATRLDFSIVFIACLWLVLLSSLRCFICQWEWKVKNRAREDEGKEMKWKKEARMDETLRRK